MTVFNQRVAQPALRVFREQQFRMQAAPDKKTIGLCDRLGNLDVLDSATLNRICGVSLTQYVGKEFFDEANSWAIVEAQHPERFAGRVIHQLRFLTFGGSCGFRQTAVAIPGKSVAVVCREDATVWPIDTKDEEGASALAFSSDGRMLAIGDFGCTCCTIDLEHIMEIAVFTAHRDVELGLFIEDIEFSPDCTCVASTNEGLCAVWERRTGKLLAKTEACSFVRFSPSREEVLLNNRRECYVWRPLSDHKRSYPWFGASITAGDWSLSGSEIVTGDYQGRIHIRGVESGDVIEEYSYVTPSEVLDICWVESGIVALFADGVIGCIAR
jgi:WD40 repeat protein